ncbi:MAG: TatD family hydrolase [Muribaculaceae bacterium]|nr:TatD family hydrolase [Muribaculaceae bacterium]
MTIFEFSDIHSHTPGDGRVLSVDVTDPADVARLEPGQYFTAGVHPWNADKPVDWAMLGELLGSPFCVGIGECGLDRRRGPDLDVQEEVLRRQLDMARSSGMPVVLHVVGAIDRVLALRKEYGRGVPWIIHGFRGKAATARQLVAAGIHLSLGKNFNAEVPEAVDPAFIHHETD